MDITNFFDTTTPERDTEAVSELIRRRRRQIVLHSYIYYWMNENVISDGEWDRLAMDLVRLQKENPDMMKQDVFDKEFIDWTGASGMDLPTTPYVRNKAEYLFKLYEKDAKLSLEIRMNEAKRKYEALDDTTRG